MNWTTPENALAALRSGMRGFVGSGCAAPQKLVNALAAKGPEVFDVEIIHILTFAGAPYARHEPLANFRHNAFFIGPNVRIAVNDGVADYTPIFLSEIPALFRQKRIHLDIALIQVSPPDRHGFCSFGVSVDVVKAAVESADCVIAEVNSKMPRTLGDSFVHVSQLDELVECAWRQPRDAEGLPQSGWQTRGQAGKRNLPPAVRSRRRPRAQEVRTQRLTSHAKTHWDQKLIGTPLNRAPGAFSPQWGRLTG